MNQPPLVSIIINNYNYGRFVAQAVESALRQTYRHVEVLVVDDGSTDHSRDVLSPYAGRATLVYKENGGQASAFNAGFARCQGDILLFLDADDFLHPGIAQKVAEAYMAHPNAAKVHYWLEIVGANGAGTGAVRPSSPRALPSGDLRRHLLAFPDDIVWQPTSGNAFAAHVIRKLFPMPEDVYRICADYYLHNLPPLFGEVVAIPEVGGYYRVHGANNHYTPQLDLENIRQVIRRTQHTHNLILSEARKQKPPRVPTIPASLISVTDAANRLISVKLEPALHPIPQDRALSLLRQGWLACRQRFDISRSARAARSLWFLAVFLSPAPVVKWLARVFYFAPDTGFRAGPFNRLKSMSYGRHADRSS